MNNVNIMDKISLKKQANNFIDKINTLRGTEKRRHKERGTIKGVFNLDDETDKDGGLIQMHNFQQTISRISEAEVNTRFEQILDDMNLSEEKKVPLRQRTIEQKRTMLSMHFKGSILNHGKLENVDEFIRIMNNAFLNCEDRLSVMSSLRVALTNNPVSWLLSFGKKQGLNAILKNLSYSFDSSQADRRCVLECIRCLRGYGNNKIGLFEIINHDEALALLSRCVDIRDPSSMFESVKLLAGTCLVLPNGHDRVVEGLTICGELRGFERFLPIVQGICIKDQSIQIACLQLLNSIVNSPEDLDLRLHLRNEFLRVGLLDAFEFLETSKNEEIITQLRIFTDLKDEDAEEFSHRYDNIRIEMDDAHDCFELLYNTTLNTPSEAYFLSILQHLLTIRDDCFARPLYFQLIEECVTQIVLHRNGVDPDFRSSKKFEIDVEPLLGKLSEDGVSTNINVGTIRSVKNRLDDTIGRQEQEIKLANLAEKNKIYEAEIAALKQKIAQTTGELIESTLTNHNPFPQSSEIPVPPPPPGVCPPPPPPLAGFIPPPPPLGGIPSLPANLVIPSFVRPKKKFIPPVQMKRANWTKINLSQLAEDSFWVQINEEKYADNDILDALSHNFTFKMNTKADNNEIENVKTFKKIKELKVLDSKTAQNISILLSAIKTSQAELKRQILEIDECNLRIEIIEQLIKCLPDSELMGKLAALRPQYDTLSEPEQFAVELTSIKRIIPRLSSIVFKIKFHEIMNEIKPDIVSATTALIEVKNSNVFHMLLELILLFGNYMNAGSRNEQTIGFEMSFLPKLANTKSANGNKTLMHFLVEIVEKKFPKALNFSDQVPHLEKVARISEDAITRALGQMSKSIKQLEIDIKNCEQDRTNLPEDAFHKTMTEFLPVAKEQFEIATVMLKKLSSQYVDVGKYFCFDVKKYLMDEFFADIKTFSDNFELARKDLDKMKKDAEKIEKARQNQINREKEKIERLNHKRMIIDINSGGDEEGVMDNLMEALKTGMAFNVSNERKEQKKRPQRAAGAERRAQLGRSRSRQNLLSPGGQNYSLSPEVKILTSTSKPQYARTPIEDAMQFDKKMYNLTRSDDKLKTQESISNGLSENRFLSPKIGNVLKNKITLDVASNSVTESKWCGDLEHKRNILTDTMPKIVSSGGYNFVNGNNKIEDGVRINKNENKMCLKENISMNETKKLLDQLKNL